MSGLLIRRIGGFFTNNLTPLYLDLSCRSVHAYGMLNDPQAGTSTIGTILVLEDELLLAVVIEDCLRDAGAADVVICTTVAEAEDAIAARRFDCAVLDVRVGGTLSFSIADQLAEQGVPFVFGSASLRDEFPEKHTKRKLLSKPFSNEELGQAVLAAICQTEKV